MELPAGDYTIQESRYSLTKSLLYDARIAKQEDCMSEKIKVYQKPTCSKCRMTISRLKEQGAAFEAINYYDKPLGVNELTKLIDKLGIAPRDLLRKSEQIYRDLKLAHRELTDDEIIQLIDRKPRPHSKAHSGQGR